MCYRSYRTIKVCVVNDGGPEINYVGNYVVLINFYSLIGEVTIISVIGTDIEMVKRMLLR
jgi:hypothetical protein